jgi:hypothetical protein
MKKLNLILLWLLCSIELAAQINKNNVDKSVACNVKSGEITLQLNKSGSIIGLFIGKAKENWIVSGETQLKGLSIVGNANAVMFCLLHLEVQ